MDNLYSDRIMRLSEGPLLCDYYGYLINLQLNKFGWTPTNKSPAWDGYSCVNTKNFPYTASQWKRDGKTIILNQANYHTERKHDSNTYLITDANVEHGIKTAPYSFGMYHCEFPLESKKPTKLLHYFINRLTTYRLKLLYLVYNNLDINACCLSVQGIQNDNSVGQLENFHKDCEEQRYFQTRMPYTNCPYSIDDALYECKINLVAESTDQVQNLTDKTFRSLQVPRPFFIYGGAGSVKWLKEMGFDIADDIVDHSYDNIENHHERRLQCIENIKKFSWKDIFIPRLLAMAQHNQNLLKEYKSQIENKIIELCDQFK